MAYNIVNTNSLAQPWSSTTAQTANYTVLAADIDVPVDSTTGPFTVTLPASPTEAETHTVSDVTGGCGGSPVTVAGNGHNIGSSANFNMGEAYCRGTFKYNATKGIWIPAQYTTRAPPLWYSPTRHTTRSAATNTSGNFTVGCQFYANVDLICIGIKFYWIVASSKSVKVSLWDSVGGTRLANVTVTVPSTGVYGGFFATPQALTAYTLYKVTCWQTDGANYTTNTSTVYFTPPGIGGVGVFWNNIKMFIAGDNVPTSTGTTETYSPEPILVYP